MVIKGNENPFLKGKPPKKHIPFILSEQSNPFQELEEDERKSIVTQIGQAAQHDFALQLGKLQTIVRGYNPLQLLAHFAYYDQLHLDGQGEKHGYTPTQQSAVEWLQALVLQVPEPEITLVLNNRPPGKVLVEANSALNLATRGFGLMRIGKEVSNTNSGLAAELMRQQTAFIRNEGFPSQIKRMHSEVFKSLDSQFLAREGYSLSELASCLWKLMEQTHEKLNDDFALRRRVLSQRTPQKMRPVSQ